MKKLLLLGASGQDGSLLAEKLIDDFELICPIRQKTETSRLHANLQVFHADMTSQKEVVEIFEHYKPDKVCNFAAFSNVFDPWTCSEDVIRANLLIPSSILLAMLQTKSNAKFVQASSSLIFGHGNVEICDEKTVRSPAYPYGISKFAADNLIQEYRSIHGINACSAILFNHESERRSSQFFTRKVVLAARQISLGEKIDKLKLGNLNAKRDMGFARDHVEATRLMILEDDPEDYVIGTGKFTCMREFVEDAFRFYGLDYKEHTILSDDCSQRMETTAVRANTMKLNCRLGWEARSFSATKLIQEELEHGEK